jgi:hypothetical protein
MAIKEGKWRCPACEAVNLGRDMKCSSCGAVRGPEVKFFLDEDAAELTDQSLLETAASGADWHCAFCGTDNRAGAVSCKQCGAPREGMKSRETGMAGAPPAAGSGAAARSPRPARKPTRFVIAAAVVVAVAVGLFLVLGRGTETTLRLQDGSWTRGVLVERQELARHEAWLDAVPAGARVLRSWEAQRGSERVQVGTEKVKTGTKDLGNGFFQDVYEDKPVYQDKPVYGTKAEYEILEWKNYRNESTQGGLSDPPIWPDPRLGPGDREGARTETSVLSFTATDPKLEGKIFTYGGAKAEELSGFSKDRDYPAVVRGDKVIKLEAVK